MCRPEKKFWMVTIAERLEALQHLRQLMDPEREATQSLIRQACAQNPWFTEEDYTYTLAHITQSYLDNEQLFEFAANYRLFDRAASLKTVGIVMAGNIPLVGFHDLLCVFLAGHVALIKWSEKDEVFFPAIMEEWNERFPWIKERIQSVQKLSGFDAVIATGSNQTARYFEEYFGKYPHIIRKNRNAIALLEGDESMEELKRLTDDVLRYFGKGCRNVSMLWVPKGYDFSRLFEVLDLEDERILHHKYKHNYDYNLAIYIINQIPHLVANQLVLLENEAISSRIGTLHYCYYESISEVEEWENQHHDEIQCVIGNIGLNGLTPVPFGQAQQPDLSTFADGIDIMRFLLKLDD